jgi:Kef-type K+ transport system membrane component KefB
MNGSAPSTRRVAAFYALTLAVGVGLFWLVRDRGERLTLAPGPGVQPTAAGGHASTLLEVLVAMVTILAVSHVLGALFRRLRQPPVMGEILGGILLGPSLLGWLAPGLSRSLFPATVTPLLGTIAQLGVLLFMFLVGLELNTGLLREQTRTTVAISHASIIVPFSLGSTLALWLYPLLSHGGVSFTAFALFLGVSMSVTAFPVLARILTDRRLQTTRLGTVALTCAAVDDVTAWCLLALVVGVIQSRLQSAVLTLVFTVCYVLLMFLVVKPLVGRVLAAWQRSGREKLDQKLLGVVCLVLLLSSLATEYIGIHTLFGAFFFGAVIPHDSAAARDLRERLHDLVVVLLLPVFFAFTGLRTRIDLIQGDQWLLCGAIILTACAGKFGGSVLAARLTGMGWRDAAALGVLMNTRGLVELIVLNIGLDLGVISPTLFAMLVLMALVTTFATCPILDAVQRPAVTPGTSTSSAG